MSWTHHLFWTVLAAMLLVGGVPGLSRAADPTFRPASAASALQLLTGGLPPCAPGHVAADCSDTPPSADAKLNYGASWTDDRHAEVGGFASQDVRRLTYQPAPSSEAESIPHRGLSNGDQVFSFTAGDTTYGQLKAYDQDGNLFGEFGSKLRN